MSRFPFWIRERLNPQTGTYWVVHGRMPVREARKYETDSLYGGNVMHRFNAKRDRDSKARKLVSSGERVYLENGIAMVAE